MKMAHFISPLILDTQVDLVAWGPSSGCRRSLYLLNLYIDRNWFVYDSHKDKSPSLESSRQLNSRSI